MRSPSRAAKTFATLLGGVWAVLFARSSEFVRPEFRPYELLINPSLPNFMPNRRVELPESFGALSYRYSMPEIRAIHPAVFSTDAAGFRNPPRPVLPAVVVAGDSFVVGVGVSDDQTIPAGLERELGEPVYNFGTQGNDAPAFFLADPRFAASPPEVLVYMPSQVGLVPLLIPEAQTEPPPAPPPPSALETRLDPLLRRWSATRQAIDGLRLRLGRDNGLQHFAKEHYRAIHRRLFGFPNQLSFEGTWVLSLTLEEQLLLKSPKEREVDEVLSSLVRFRDALALRGTRLLVVPVPGNGDVYPDLFSPEERGRLQRPGLYDVLLERLPERGIPVLDLRVPFAAHRSPYLYLVDDTHLSPRGTALAAAELARALRAHPEWRRR